MRHLVALAMVLLAASRVHAGVVTVADGTFAPTDWEIAFRTFRHSHGVNKAVIGIRDFRTSVVHSLKLDCGRGWRLVAPIDSE